MQFNFSIFDLKLFLILRFPLLNCIDTYWEYFDLKKFVLIHCDKESENLLLIIIRHVQIPNLEKLCHLSCQFQYAKKCSGTDLIIKKDYT